MFRATVNVNGFKQEFIIDTGSHFNNAGRWKRFKENRSSESETALSGCKLKRNENFRVMTGTH